VRLARPIRYREGFSGGGDQVIGVIHAYSRSNAGDGLLVDLTLERLRRVGVPREDVLLVALDPDSFDELPHRMPGGARGRGLSWELLPAAGRGASLAASALTGLSFGKLARKLRGCDALVAVGGGYLRSVDPVSSVGTLLNHLPQLLMAGRVSGPSLYLPQSVGPLRGLVGRAVRAALCRVDTVWVRDRTSEAELEGLFNVRRSPDLAVLDVAERWDEIDVAGTDGRIGIVARQVPHAGGYEKHVDDLSQRLGDRGVWAVQTTGDPTKSDAVHYERLGITAGGDLVRLLEENQLSLVVSVRLHGALMALEAGVPAIHLAYDRKGPGAFADLGLDEWCFDVRALDGEVLHAAVEQLLQDPQPYWDSLGKQVPTLQTASADLDSVLDEVIGAGVG
jgi:polysaccharide pyruvyl transferase WcaK-like protein